MQEILLQATIIPYFIISDAIANVPFDNSPSLVVKQQDLFMSVLDPTDNTTY